MVTLAGLGAAIRLAPGCADCVRNLGRIREIAPLLHPKIPTAPALSLDYRFSPTACSCISRLCRLTPACTIVNAVSGVLHILLGDAQVRGHRHIAVAVASAIAAACQPCQTLAEEISLVLLAALLSSIHHTLQCDGRVQHQACTKRDTYQVRLTCAPGSAQDAGECKTWWRHSSRNDVSSCCKVQLWQAAHRL